MLLTFLYGQSAEYSPAKSFETRNGKIEKVSGYDVGYLVYHNVANQPEDLAVVADTLRNFAGAGWFRINGAPIQEIAAHPESPVRRITENFPEQTTKFTTFDLDNWPVSPDMSAQHGWTLDKPETTAALIRHYLRQHGLSSLAMSDFIFLLTSSQFTRATLNCHLYFLLETPRTLSQMRMIATGFNTFKGEKLLDTAPYKAVQPDYIAPPKCLNFADPIPAHARIYYSQGSAKFVPESEFSKNILDNLPKDWLTSGLVDPLGKNWLDSIRRFVGSDQGINNPAFRAAAQLANEVGKVAVLANIDAYAKQMHDEAWKAILLHGKRGDAKDRATYNVARFKQYLESATRSHKEFGKGVDDSAKLVLAAIEDAAKGNTYPLTDRVTLSGAAKLMTKHPATWMTIRAQVRKQLKGIISVADFEKLVKQALSNDTAVNSTAKTATGELVSLSSAQGEDMLIRPMLSTYRFILDRDGNFFMQSPDSEHKVLAFNGEMVNIFYRDAMQRTGDNVSLMFGRKCMSMLIADKISPNNNSLHISRADVAKRTMPIGDTITDGCWINLGVQKSGRDQCAKITPGKVEIFDKKDTSIKWLEVCSSLIPTEQDFSERFPHEKEPTPEFLISFYRANILKYIVCDKEDLVALTSWLVTALTSRPLSYIGEFVGSYGCGKSTGSDFAKNLIDPTEQSLAGGGTRSTFSGKPDENFFAVVSDQLVTIFDNIGVLSAQVQDLFCQISTGMRYSLRILYTQTQLDRFIQRPIILTGLAQMITRPDLISRAMCISFSKIPSFNPNYLDEWERDRPYLFGGLLHIAAKAMEHIKNISGTSASLLSQRDIVIAAVAGVLHNLKGVDTSFVEYLNTEKHMIYVRDNNFVMLFIAFLQGLPQNDYTLPVYDIRNRFQSWVEQHIGTQQVVTVRTASGVSDTIGVRVTNAKLPENSVGFGWALSKATHAINAVSGWEFYDHKRMASGKTRSFRRKLLLTDIL